MPDLITKNAIWITSTLFAGAATISTCFLKLVRKSEIYNNDGTTKYIPRIECEKNAEQYYKDNNRMFKIIQDDIKFLKDKSIKGI